jgi:hypothetical protein
MVILSETRAGERKERAEGAIWEATKVRLPIKFSVTTTSVMGRSVRCLTRGPPR